jgi:LuxR family maltose regulon positive regulatory protein
MADLERALTLARPERVILPFVHHARGTGLGALLSQVCSTPSTHPAALHQARKVLERLTPDEGPPAGGGPPPQDFADSNRMLIEPLTDRELDVLRFLNSPLSSSEIADELYVSVNTVRTHIRNIYAKLGAHRRSEAVARAQGLGLL